MLGRSIDVDDHLYLEFLAVGERQCPPLSMFCGGLPLLSSSQKQTID